MASIKRALPDLSNATPDFCMAEIQAARNMVSEAKFIEGVYKEKLSTFREQGKSVIDGSDYICEYVQVTQERIDTDAIKAAFSRDELIKRGFLKVIEFEQLKVTKKNA